MFKLLLYFLTSSKLFYTLGIVNFFFASLNGIISFATKIRKIMKKK